MSYVKRFGRSNVGLDHVPKHTKVRFRLSETQTFLWTINDDKYDKGLKQKVYQLRKADGRMYTEWVKRDQFALEDEDSYSWGHDVSHTNGRENVKPSPSAPTKAMTDRLPDLTARTTSSPKVIVALPDRASAKPSDDSSSISSVHGPIDLKSSTGPSLQFHRDLTSATSMTEHVQDPKDNSSTGNDDRRTILTGTNILALDLPADGVSLIASKIAQELLHATTSAHPEPTDGSHGQIEVTEDLLRFFAIMLRREARSSIEIKTCDFVRQQRKLIVSRTQARQTEEEEDSKAALSLPNDAFDSAINSWMDGQVGALPPPPDGPAVDDIDTTASSVEFDDLGAQFTTATTFLKQSTSWPWLVDRLSSSKSRTSWRSVVTDEVLQASSSTNVLFRVAWNPLSYMQEQFCSDPWPQLASTVAVTYDDGLIQTTTCGQYVLQTWSTIGNGILVCIQDAIDKRFLGNTEYQLSNLNVKFEMLEDKLCVQASGHTGHIVCLGEQLAWLGAVCCSSLYSEDMQYREACAVCPPGTLGVLEVTYRNRDLGPKNGDSCWRSLFRNTCIASGFPVPTREKTEPGLEIDPTMMVTLGETDLITTFNGHFMLKGFSSVFVPMRHSIEASTIYWHFIHTAGGDFVPYSAASDSCLGDEMFAAGDFQWMAALRHFIGWAPHAKVCAGTADHPYHLIKPPASRKAGPGVVAEKLGIGFSHHVTLNVMIARGTKDKPLWLSRTPHYDREIVHARSQHVALFDTLDRRAWLLDGASALLHLTCAQLRVDRDHLWEPQATAKFLYADCSKGRSASDALRDEHNRSLILRKDEERWEDLEVGANGKIVPKEKRKITYFQVQNLVLENWTVLTKLWERQREPHQGLDLKLPYRKRLTGWSFTELMSQTPDMILQTFKIPSHGTGWDALVTRTSACILMCSGLGELIQPIHANGSCERWSSVPTSQNLLATTVGELRKIRDKYGHPDMLPDEILPGLRWNHPHELFEPCNCVKGSDNQFRAICARVRPLKKQSRWDALAGDKVTSSWKDMPSESAAIFGIYESDQSKPRGSKALLVAPQPEPDSETDQRLQETPSTASSMSSNRQRNSTPNKGTSSISDDLSDVEPFFNSLATKPSLPTTPSDANPDHHGTPSLVFPPETRYSVRHMKHTDQQTAQELSAKAFGKLSLRGAHPCVTKTAKSLHEVVIDDANSSAISSEIASPQDGISVAKGNIPGHDASMVAVDSPASEYFPCEAETMDERSSTLLN